MKKLLCAAVLAGLWFNFNASLRAAFFEAIPAARQMESSTAVFRGEVVSAKAYVDPDDGQIYTRAAVRVDEVFKGKLPARVRLVHRGGFVGERGEVNDFSPALRAGEERLFFVSRRADGSLFATRGTFSAVNVSENGQLLAEVRSQAGGSTISGGDVTDQAAGGETPAGITPDDDVPPFSSATNLITGPNSVGPRFIQQDRGELIPYLIDVQYLTNISQAQALGAVQAAIAAWSAATSLRFQFIGLQNFGVAAANVNAGDGVLRIQLHDHYNFINGGGDTVAEGGSSDNSTTLSSGWTPGGNVIGNDFYQITSPWVVVQMTNNIFQSESNLAECLGHEIGHAIGLGHSSNDPNETNSILNQAIMYFRLHEDGRGAALNVCDTNVSQQLYPPFNTPPYTYNRNIDVVSAPTTLNVPGINAAQVPGFDLQTTAANLVFQISAASANNGTFSTSGDVIIYTPEFFFSDAPRTDPAGNSFYDTVYARYSDGTNASPFAQIKVLSFNEDDYSEGVPDTWRNTYFGNPDPSVGANHHANQDADGDGYSNLQEWIFGSNPTDKTSNLRITSFSATNLQWQAKPYELYEIYGSTDLKTWSLAMNPIIPTSSVGVATNFNNGGGWKFFRVQKVP